jgi:ABC-type lipoprotein export system ATPase subunit
VTDDRPTLAVRGVSHNVLHGVDLTAGPGTLVALTGHSGSGKSTLCHVVAGLESPESGTVTWDGVATTDITDWSRISVVPQRLSLLEQLTAVENLMLPSIASKRSLTAGAAYAMLERVGVEPLANRAAGQGSIGEQQRIAVARALVLESELIVLDEPTAHQDDENAERVITAILAAVQAGALVVCSTHDPRLLARADQRLALGSS